MAKWLTLTRLLPLILLTASAHARDTGFLDGTVSVGGEAYRYQVFVPADWSNAVKWPVILFLHGAGERGNDGLRQTSVGLPEAIRENPAAFPFVVVMPQCRANQIWSDPPMAAQALAALDSVVKEFHGDRDRLYLTGMSMGGYGTWDYAARMPGTFAALVVVCGGLAGPKFWPQLHVPMMDDPKIADPYAETARRVGKTPVWIFHGDADDTIPVGEARKMAAALKAPGANFQYTEYVGVGHDSWLKAYAEPRLGSWLLEQRLQH